MVEKSEEKKRRDLKRRKRHTVEKKGKEVAKIEKEKKSRNVRVGKGGSVVEVHRREERERGRVAVAELEKRR